MIKTKGFIDDRCYDYKLEKEVGSAVDENINDFLSSNNVKYIDVKYQSSVSDTETDVRALLIYEEVDE